MGKIISFVHISIDGFVAGPSGEMDWIQVDEEIFDYVSDRINLSGTAIYGRVTYQMMESYWPTAADQPGASKHDIEHSKWYAQVEKIVLSRSMKGQSLKNTKIISDNIKDEMTALKNKKGKDIPIFGSPSATHAFMQHNLIDGYWLFVNPIVLGNGIPLFKNIQDRTKLKLVSSHAFKSGVICLDYEVLR